MKKVDQETLYVVFIAILVVVFFYMGVSWFIFEWRNPLCNEAAFFKHFPSVMSWKKLPQYQEQVYQIDGE